MYNNIRMYYADNQDKPRPHRPNAVQLEAVSSILLLPPEGS